MKKSPAITMPLPLPHILAVEASANRLSIAVMVNGEVVAARDHHAAHGHAVGIVPLSIETVNDAGVTFDMITHVAAGCGPGSFTGIRIALAAAKGFCMAHRATGVGVSGLQALAHAANQAASGTKRPCLVLADTRRGSFYAQIFDSIAQPIGTIFETTIQQVPYLTDIKMAGSGLSVIGTDRIAVADSLIMAGIAADLPEIDEMPSASMVACVANEQIINNQTSPLQPLYITNPRLGSEKKSG